MKWKATCLLAVSLVLSMGTIAHAAPSSDVPKSQACVDIIDGANLRYTDNPVMVGTTGLVGTTQPEFDGSLITQAPTCLDATYTMYVLDSSGTNVLASQSLPGNGQADANGHGSVTFNVVVNNGPSDVCVYATSQLKGKIVDRAPDTGCFAYALDTNPGYFWK